MAQISHKMCQNYPQIEEAKDSYLVFFGESQTEKLFEIKPPLLHWTFDLVQRPEVDNLDMKLKNQMTYFYSIFYEKKKEIITNYTQCLVD